MGHPRQLESNAWMDKPIYLLRWPPSIDTLLDRRGLLDDEPAKWDRVMRRAQKKLHMQKTDVLIVRFISKLRLYEILTLIFLNLVNYRIWRIQCKSLFTLVMIAASHEVFGQDCNSNGIDDACELSCGSTGGLCDVPGCGTKTDCNLNGIPDDCDIIFGGFADCNLNGIPDECDLMATTLQRVTASDPQPLASFGNSLAIQGDIAVIGAEQDEAMIEGGSNVGAVYVFRRDALVWQQVTKLIALDGQPGAYFGNSVAIDGDTIVIGARRDGSAGLNSGSVYVFRELEGAWVQEAKLTASDAASGDRFGVSVAIEGNTVVVGANYKWVPGQGARVGCAYIFERSEDVWQEVAKLTADDPQTDDYFGSLVAISDGIVAIGTPYDDDEFGNNVGSISFFEMQQGVWAQTEKFLNNDDPAAGIIGNLFILLGDWLVIGKPDDDEAGNNAGAILVYERIDSVWELSSKIFPDDPVSQHRFGFSVAFYDDVLVAGTYFGSKASEIDTAYLFRKFGDTWEQIVKLTDGDDAGGDNFGTTVAVDGETAIIGARTDNLIESSGTGAAYFVTLPQSNDCNGNTVLDQCESDADGDGTIDACDNCPNQLTGDVNGDSLVDISDIAGFAAISLNSTVATEDELCAADINEDGLVDGRDIQSLVNNLLLP